MEVSQAEIFLEAVPTVFVLTHVGTKSFGLSGLGRAALTRGHQRFAHTQNEGKFMLAYLTSITSASLGMAKALKVGVCKVLPDTGLLDGLLTVRFVFLFFTCVCILVIKAFGINSSFSTIVGFLVPTLPGLVIGLISIRHRAMLKTFLNHPSLLLLPVFTFFTFESNICCGCGTHQKEVEITFSPGATILNMVVSIALQCIAFALMHDQTYLIAWTLNSAIPTFLWLCFLEPKSNLPDHPPEFNVYLPSSPDKVFIKDKKEPDGRKEIIVEG